MRQRSWIVIIMFHACQSFWLGGAGRHLRCGSRESLPGTAGNLRMTINSWRRISSSSLLMNLRLAQYRRILLALGAGVIVVVFSLAGFTRAQQRPPSAENSATLTVRVLDPQGQPLANARVHLVDELGTELTGQTGLDGMYRFGPLAAGTYRLRGEGTNLEGSAAGIVLISRANKRIDLPLQQAQRKDSGSPVNMPEFFDDPKFTAAGVSDPSNLGGHGSNTRMPASEALRRATTSLKRERAAMPASAEALQLLRQQADRQPQDFELNYRAGSALLNSGRARDAIPYLRRAAEIRTDEANSYELARAYSATGDHERARALAKTMLSRNNTAPLHHLLATVEEKAGNPLQAVTEFQLAAELDPSEESFFEWGSELLLHHAFGPASEVFEKGNRLFPRSQRMVLGLAVARYSSGDDDEALRRLCEASDLDPRNTIPYEFMGRIIAAGSFQSNEVWQRLARFANLQPENARANYYYALSLWKRTHGQNDEENEMIKRLLQKAVRLDPKYGAAFLQLGILYADHGDLQSALQPLITAVQVSPELPDAHYRLARVYSLLGEKAKAQQEFSLYQKTTKAANLELERQRREVRQLVFTLKNTENTAPKN